MVHGHHYPESAEVEGGKEGTIGIVDLCNVAFPDPELEDFVLQVVPPLDVPSLV